MNKDNAQTKLNINNYIKRSLVNEFLYLGTVMCEFIEQLENDMRSDKDKFEIIENFMITIVPVKNLWTKSLDLI